MEEDEDYVPSEEHGDEEMDEDALLDDDMEDDYDDETAFLTAGRAQRQSADEEEEDGGAPDDFFDEGFDPMSLLDQMGQHEQGSDPAEHGPYEVFTRAIDRDSSAQPKEKSVGTKQGTKKARGGVFGATIEDIWDEDQVADELGYGYKRRKSSRRRQKGSKKPTRSRHIPEEVNRKVGEATMCYTLGKYEGAIGLLMEVIKIHPYLQDTYHTLGLAHEALGRQRQALDFYMIAVHMTPSDVDLWRRLANLSTKLGFFRQAIYCYTKVVARDKDDLDAKYDRALLYAEVNEPKKAVTALEGILTGRPGEPEEAVLAMQLGGKQAAPCMHKVVKMLARLHHRMGAPEKAAEVLEQQVRDYPDATDLTHINILAELFMDEGKHEQAISFIRRAEQLPCMHEGIPVDLTVRAGMCAARLQDIDTAMEHFSALFAVDPADFADLYLDVGDLLVEQRRYDQALVFYNRLAEHPGQSTPEVWSRLAGCHQALGSYDSAAGIFLKILGDASLGAEALAEAATALAELYVSQGQAAAALEILYSLQGMGAVLSPQSPAIWPLHWRRASLFLKLGHTEPFLDLMLPVLSRTLRTSEAASSTTASGKRMRAALRRRARVAQKYAHTQEHGAVFKGFVTRHCQKESAKEADPRLAELDQAYAETLPDGTLEDEYCTAAETGGFVLQEHVEQVHAGPSVPGEVLTWAAMLQGFVTRDRRKESAKEADQRLAELEEAYAETLPEGAGEDGAAAAVEAGGFVLDDVFNNQSQFEAVLHTLRVLLGSGQPQEAQQLTDEIQRMFSKRGTHRDKKDALRLVLSEAAAAQGDSAGAMHQIRYVAARHPRSPVVWNAYARAVACSGSMRPALRHLTGMRQKFPDSLPLMVLLGNSYTIGGNYSLALNECLHAYRHAPQEPLILLCMGVAMLNQVMHKKVPDRNRGVLQAFAFLQEYAVQRCNEQETAYNLGRAAHQLGLLHVAVPFYERALVAKPPLSSSIADVRREAAHNLVLIYRSTGATGMARHIMREHLTF